MRKFRKHCVLSGVSLLASVAACHSVRAATLIYGFNDPTISGFTGNGASVAQSTTTGVTEGTDALEILNKSTQTYGGAITATVPANFYDAPSFNVSVTITTTPMVSGSAVYFDLVPVFYSTDGEIDPDTSNPNNFINLGGLAPGTYTYDVNLAAYSDPDGVLTTDATPGAILLADQAYDLANNVSTTDAITGFQLTVEHGSGTPTTLYVDNLTVPSVSVPEPASVGLLVAGGALTLGRRRAKQLPVAAQ